MQPAEAQSESIDSIGNLEAALLSMDRVRARLCFEESGLAPLEFAERVVAAALERIGESWEKGAIALSQVYMSGRICEELLSRVIPDDPSKPAAHPPMAIAVLDDFHPLGKRIVTSVLRANGFSVTDYGPTPVEELLAKVQRDGIRILLISTLMLPSALKVREVRDGIDALGLDVRLVVGGAPFRLDPDLWREVGADATCNSASGTVKILWQLLEGVPCTR